MNDALITGLTRGGDTWVSEFVTELNAQNCIGCGRCYKVCPREVFELVDRSEVLDHSDDLDDDDEMKVMTIRNALDCSGCKSCSRVCPKQCHSHAAFAA